MEINGTVVVMVSRNGTGEEWWGSVWDCRWNESKVGGECLVGNNKVG